MTADWAWMGMADKATGTQAPSVMQWFALARPS